MSTAQQPFCMLKAGNIYRSMVPRLFTVSFDTIHDRFSIQFWSRFRIFMLCYCLRSMGLSLWQWMKNLFYFLSFNPRFFELEWRISVPRKVNVGLNFALNRFDGMSRRINEDEHSKMHQQFNDLWFGNFDFFSLFALFCFCSSFFHFFFFKKGTRFTKQKPT